MLPCLQCCPYKMMNAERERERAKVSLLSSSTFLFWFSGKKKGKRLGVGDSLSLYRFPSYLFINRQRPSLSHEGTKDSPLTKCITYTYTHTHILASAKEGRKREKEKENHTRERGKQQWILKLQLHWLESSKF